MWKQRHWDWLFSGCRLQADRFTMNDIFMIPNSLKTKIKDLTSREILKEAILIRDIENGDNLIEVETVSNNVNNEN